MFCVNKLKKYKLLGQKKRIVLFNASCDHPYLSKHPHIYYSYLMSILYHSDITTFFISTLLDGPLLGALSYKNLLYVLDWIEIW